MSPWAYLYIFYGYVHILLVTSSAHIPSLVTYSVHSNVFKSLFGTPTSPCLTYSLQVPPFRPFLVRLLFLWPIFLFPSPLSANLYLENLWLFARIPSFGDLFCTYGNFYGLFCTHTYSVHMVILTAFSVHIPPLVGLFSMSTTYTWSTLNNRELYGPFCIVTFC